MSATAHRKADYVAEDLLRRIVRGEHPVGSVLPKEAELAAHYGVNRSVVREAIKLLEVHRLVRPVRRRGTVVLDPMASLSPEVLRALLSPRDGQVDRTVLASLLEIRAQLDEQMTMLAAQRRTDADLAQMDRILQELAAALGNRERYEQLQDDLALAIARATHNPIFEMFAWWHRTVATDLADVYRAVRPANEPHLSGVRLMVDAIRAGQAEQVRDAVRAFHAWATPRMLAAAALHAGVPLSQVMEELR